MVLPIKLIIAILIFAIIFAFSLYLLILLVKSLKKYLKSEDTRTEKKEIKITLGEVIKKHRTELHMTQEFVAESLGVSRQAVSKWESGKSDPSTSNLIALASLFEISVEDLLKEIKK